jgi:uncharacterized membrane protein YeaQ/YmgE (transglycosylase-associated protein family)
MQLFYFLLIGLVAGWLAGRLLKGRGLGLLGNLVVGVLGALLGGHLLQWAGIATGHGLVGALLSATLGALVVLGLVAVLKRL